MNLQVLVFLLTTVLHVNGAPQHSDKQSATTELDDLGTLSNDLQKSITSRTSSVTNSFNKAGDSRYQTSNSDSSLVSVIWDSILKLISSVTQKRESSITLFDNNLKLQEPSENNDLVTKIIINPFISCEVRKIRESANDIAAYKRTNNAARLDLSGLKDFTLEKSVNTDSFSNEENKQFSDKVNHLPILSKKFPSLLLNEDTLGLDFDNLLKLYPLFTRWITSNILSPFPLLHQPSGPVFKRSVSHPHSVNTREIIEPPFVGGGIRFPQSVAGSSLYGSYAYAHISPFGEVAPIEGEGGGVGEPIEGGVQEG